MLSRRFLLSLVVGLSLSALASANSASVHMTFLHSDNTDSGNAAPAIFGASNYVSTDQSRDAHFSGPLSGTVTYGQHVTDYKSRGSASLGGIRGTRFTTDNWAGAGRGTSTPEPASLLLLSTGLIGIAGLMRRKLRA